MNTTSKRMQSVIVALLAALLVPRIERWTGIKLNEDDIGALVGGAVAAWHGAAAVIEPLWERFAYKYLPPIPTSPAQPAK